MTFGTSALQRENGRQVSAAISALGPGLLRPAVPGDRRPPPPIGWYLPEVVSGVSELDSFDTIEGLVLRGGIELPPDT